MASQEIRPNRDIPDQVLTDRTITGDVAFEMSFGVADDILAASLQDSVTWHGLPVIANAAVTAGTPNVFSVASAAGIVANHLIYASGFSTAANNGVFVVSSVTGTTITCSSAPPTAETSGATKKVKVIGFTSTAGDITATATGLGSTALNFTTLGLAVGQWVDVGGAAAGAQFATAANNSFARIVAIAPNALTLDNLPQNWAPDPGTGKSIRVGVLDYIRNGTAQQSFTIERGHTDAGQYFQFTGLYPEKLALSLQAGQILDATVTMRGIGAPSPTAASASTGGLLPAPTASILNAVSNIVRLYEGGAAAGKVKQATWNAMNALRDQKAIGVLGNYGVGDGQFSATMTMAVYLTATAGIAIYSKFINATVSQLSFPVQDAAGNTYIFELPAVKFTDCQPPSATVNQDQILSFTASALIDTAVTGAMAQISRIAGAGY
ncbi:MAG: hypothetical protein F8N39_17115 [Clostridiaceae bacterium]|nr:hypothetical protein [Clostridiaceae bacterium]